MTKMLQSGIGRAMLAAATVAVAVFAALALDRADADAQAGSVKSLSVGGDHACALTRADEIICWGRNDAGQTDAPKQHEFASLSLGEAYSCGLNSFEKISAGYISDDTYRDPDCWGTLPELDPSYASIPGRSRRYSLLIIAFNTRFSSPEAIGITHGCAWGGDNYSCSGSNAFGQHGLRDRGASVIGGWHTCLIDNNNGSIQCVGRNDSGQTDVPNGQYLSVDAGREHTCAVTDESRLRCWGEDALGQSSPPGGSDYLEVSSNAFANFNCALTDERKVRCWGDNRYGQTNVPAAIAAPPPLQFAQPVEWIIARKGQPIGPFVLPPASGGKGRLSYNIAHTRDGQRKKGAPLGLVFDETTRRLSGRVFDDPGGTEIHYRVSDTSGRTEEIDFGLSIYGPVPAGYAPAITWPELGTLDRGLLRCSAWTEESRVSGGSWGRYEGYTFRIAAPTQLTISLESEEVDTYLSLLGGSDFWQDDDGGQGTNSRLSVGLAPARYSIYVYGADGQAEGAYTLRITSPDFIIGNADASASCPSGRTTTTEGSLDSASAGRIVARRLADGRTEFAWHVEDGDRVLPRQRYLPASPPTGRWLNSSEIIVEGVNVGRINVRVRADDGRVEFAFTPAGGERILPRSRYFPSNAETDVWLRSTLIEPGG